MTELAVAETEKTHVDAAISFERFCLAYFESYSNVGEIDPELSMLRSQATNVSTKYLVKDFLKVIHVSAITNKLVNLISLEIG